MKVVLLERDKENRKVQFLLLVSSSWLSQTSSLFQAFLAILGLALSNLFPHLH